MLVNAKVAKRKSLLFIIALSIGILLFFNPIKNCQQQYTLYYGDNFFWISLKPINHPYNITLYKLQISSALIKGFGYFCISTPIKKCLKA